MFRNKREGLPDLSGLGVAEVPDDGNPREGPAPTRRASEETFGDEQKQQQNI